MGDCPRGNDAALPWGVSFGTSSREHNATSAYHSYSGVMPGETQPSLTMNPFGNFSELQSPAAQAYFDLLPTSQTIVPNTMASNTVFVENVPIYANVNHVSHQPLLDVPAVRAYSGLLPAPSSTLQSSRTDNALASNDTTLHSKDQWEAKKAIIYQLWILDDRPWSSTKSPRRSVDYILRNEHDFPVTRRQFTRKVEEWRFFKSIKKKEMKAMNNIERERAQNLGKRTQFLLRGRPVPPEKLDRWRRRQITGPETIETDSISVTRLVVSTPNNVEETVSHQTILWHTPKSISSPMTLLASPVMSGTHDVDIDVNDRSMVDFELEEPVASAGQKRYLEDSNTGFGKRVKTSHTITEPLYLQTDYVSSTDERETAVAGVHSRTRISSRERPQRNNRATLGQNSHLSSVVMARDVSRPSQVVDLSVDVKNLNIISSPRLSRLLEALVRQTNDEVPHLLLDGNDESAEENPDPRTGFPKRLVSHPNAVSLKLPETSAPLLSFRNRVTTPKYLIISGIPGTLAWYQKEEVKWKRDIFRLHDDDVPLADRLPAISKLALALKEQYRYSEAERLFRHVAVQSRQMHGKTDQRTIVAYCETIQCLLDQGKLVNASRINQALQIGTRNIRSSNKTALQHLLYVDARVSHGLFKNDAAERRYRELVQLVLTTDGLGNRQLWTYLQSLALVMYNQKLLKESEEIANVLLRLESSGFINPPVEVLHSTRRLLGNIYVDQGKFVEGEIVLKKVLIDSQEVFGQQHKGTLAAKRDFAACMHKRGNYAEAVRARVTALDNCERVLGATHPITLSILSDLLIASQELYKYEEAIKHSLQLVERYEASYGVEAVQTVDIYNKLGLDYMSLGRYAMSLKWHLRAASGYEKMYGIEHLSTSGVYENLGQAYYHEKNHEESVHWYRKAVVAHEKLGTRDFQIREVFENLGRSLFNHQNYMEAIDWYSKAIVAHEKYSPTKCVKALELHEQVGEAYLKHGSYLKAAGQYKDVVIKYEKIYGTSCAGPVRLYGCVGDSLDRAGNYAESAEWYTKAAVSYESFFGSKEPWACERLGTVFEKMDRLTESLFWFEKAAKGNEYRYGAWYHKSVPVYEHLGRICDKLKRYSQSLEWYQLATAAYERLDGLRRDTTQGAFRELMYVYNKVRCGTKSLRWNQRTIEAYERFCNASDIMQSLEAIHYLGNACSFEKDHEEAVKWHRKALVVWGSLLNRNPGHLHGYAGALDSYLKACQASQCRGSAFVENLNELPCLGKCLEARHQAQRKHSTLKLLYTIKGTYKTLCNDEESSVVTMQLHEAIEHAIDQIFLVQKIMAGEQALGELDCGH